MAEAYSYPADIWAFALILLELATVRSPAAGELFCPPRPHPGEDAPRLPERCGLSAALADPQGLRPLLDKSPRADRVHAICQHPWLKQAEARGGARARRETRA